MNYRTAAFSIFLFASFLFGYAQSDSLLSKKITVSVKNRDLKTILNTLTVLSGVPFSYNDNILPDRPLSIHEKDITLKQVLDKLLPPLSMHYKPLNGNIVIVSYLRKNYKGSQKIISGYVREAGSGESLIGVNIFIPGTGIGTATNNFGYYSFSLPEGEHVVAFTYVGYSSKYMLVNMKQDTVAHVLLSEDIAALEEVIVENEDNRESQRLQMSKISLPIHQIKDIPALLGEKDVLKVLQLMPGIQRGNDGQTGFYVRGGGPDQNLIILDDATVYNTSHLFGFFSIFNGDALKSVEITKGGFPARYGGRLSSVLEMTMKDGNREKFEGEASIGLIASRATIEGPIKKNKSSFIISGRRTYLDALLFPFLPRDNRAGYFFYDINAKINYDINAKNKVYLSGYFGKDKFYYDVKENNYSSSSGFDWGNGTLTARWNHVFNKKIFSNTSFIYSNYLFNITGNEKNGDREYALKFSSGIQDLSAKYDMDIFLSNRHRIKTGFLATYHQFIPSAVVVKDDYVQQNSNTVFLVEAFEAGVYAEDEFYIGPRFKANTGIRFSSFTNRGSTYFNPEPRVAVAYRLRDDLSLKGSYAIMNQFVHLLSNTGVGLTTDLWIPSTKNIEPQHSWQAAMGIAKDFMQQGFSVTLEGYYKKSWSIIGYKEGANFIAVENTNSINNYSWENIITSGQGWSYGAEILAQKKTGRLSGWIGYTLSWTQQQFDELNRGEKFWAKYDRRHNVSVVGIYKFNERFSLSLTWVYNTGNAITLPLSSYTGAQNVPAFLGFGNELKITEYSEKNGFRMRDYHRLDIAFRSTKKKKWGERTFEVGCYNAYNRQNPLYYFIKYENNGTRTLNQLSIFPVIPSVSWTFKF